jgi:hypothetical protein
MDSSAGHDGPSRQYGPPPYFHNILQIWFTGSDSDDPLKNNFDRLAVALFLSLTPWIHRQAD